MPVERASGVAEDGWRGPLVRLVVILVGANLLVDVVVVAPLLALPQMMQHFETDQAAWLNASALLTGAMWAPLLGRTADIHGKRRILVVTMLVTFAGSLICLIAPNVVVFVLGRFLQGAVMGTVLLTVAITRRGCGRGGQICTPRVGMTAVGDAWEAGLRPFITEQQDSARVKQQRFVPSSRPAELLRSVVLGLARRIIHHRLAAEATAPQAAALSGTTR